MNAFSLSEDAIDPAVEKRRLDDAGAGACVIFEGWVRNHNDGRAVHQLDYQAYAPLALSEGESILIEALRRFSLRAASAVHRTGSLAIGDLAVWVGVSADHRGAAYDASRWIIDEIKLRVPIWKNEHYADGESGWLHPDNTPVDA
ncbi:MAG TPA: molybdenum cofactor biosynthesis protein MoaE [Dokdonella sp.]|uniref:molybdenum cofactor biosynthesis protein MoaE n=1 Tax=Dokdonella sp. TaxID=2291710 RepID=UPI002D7F248F|nr:molybdenum cofactor biosynthesis protein MoaE [Dokdonella sp.]HET9033677.1 molybdenum cofactor biosynthesis protein MoaE [Dokdonella sp.]